VDIGAVALSWIIPVWEMACTAGYLEEEKLVGHPPGSNFGIYMKLFRFYLIPMAFKYLCEKPRRLE